MDQMFAKIGLEPKIAYETEGGLRWWRGWWPRASASRWYPYMELLHRLEVSILKISALAWERQLFMISDPKASLSPRGQSVPGLCARQGR